MVVWLYEIGLFLDIFKPVSPFSLPSPPSCQDKGTKWSLVAVCFKRGRGSDLVYREQPQYVRARSCVERLPALAGIPLLLKTTGNYGHF